MAFITTAGGQPIRSTHVNQFSQWITGTKKDTSGAITTTHATEYALTVTNEDTSAGNVLKVVSGSSTIALFNKTGATINVPVTATGILAGVLQTAGDIIYSISGTTGTRLAIGTAFQSLNVNAGATAPQWMASLQSLMASAGSLVGASGANTPVHIPKGSAFQSFIMNAGATGQTWASDALALAQTSGDTFFATAANTLARLAKGADGTVLTLASGLPSWASAASVSVSHENLIVNGTGRTKQRTTLPTTDNAYGFDRWRILMENTTGATLSQETSDLPVPGPGYAMKLTVGAGNNGKFGHWQPILFADMRDVAGQTVSLQAKLKAVNLSDIRMAVMQFAGTADSISGDPISAWGGAGTLPTLAANWSFANTAANLSVSTTWATYTVASISVASAAVNLAVMIWNDDRTTTQTTDYLLMTDVQLERGTTCTTPDPVKQDAEEHTCLSWLQIINAAASNITSFATGETDTTTTGFFNLNYLRRMRSAPIGSVSTAVHFAVVTNNAATACTALTISAAGVNAARLDAVVASGLTAGNGARLIANSTTSAAITLTAEP